MFKSTGFWQYSTVIGFLGVSVLNPHDYATWLSGGVGVSAVVLMLLWIRRHGIEPSPLLSWVLVLHACILIYGAWHSYSRAPLGEMWSGWFGWERNHYDRLAHFAQGFLPAVLIREVLIRNNVVNGVGWRELLVFSCAMASAAIFELIEFGVAVGLGDGTHAYLGSQGDPWDAQWDMLWCGVGALMSIGLIARPHGLQLAQLKRG